MNPVSVVPQALARKLCFFCLMSIDDYDEMKFITMNHALKQLTSPQALPPLFTCRYAHTIFLYMCTEAQTCNENKYMKKTSINV